MISSNSLVLSPTGPKTRNMRLPPQSAVDRASRTAAIGDVAVRAGDRVILATFAANRALGPFDPERQPAASLKQLWFGAGSHFCLGAPLALAQVRATLDALKRMTTPAEVAAKRGKTVEEVLG